MDDEIEQLHRFSAFADQVREEPLTRKGGMNHSFHLSYDGLRLTAKLREPRETDFKSLLMTLRRCVMDKEPVFLNRIYNLTDPLHLVH